MGETFGYSRVEERLFCKNCSRLLVSLLLYLDMKQPWNATKLFSFVRTVAIVLSCRENKPLMVCKLGILVVLL
jgi:hypothetical protein